MNSLLLVNNVFLFVFWKKLKTPKRHFKISDLQTPFSFSKKHTLNSTRFEHQHLLMQMFAGFFLLLLNSSAWKNGVQIQYMLIRFGSVKKSHYLCDSDRPLAATFIEGCFQERRLIVRISFSLYSNLSSKGQLNSE